MKNRIVLVFIVLAIFIANTLFAQQLLPGDADGDGNVDIVDALKIAQFFVGLEPIPFYENEADANCDTTIDIIDALLVAQSYVGLTELYPCPTPDNRKYIFNGYNTVGDYFLNDINDQKNTEFKILQRSFGRSQIISPNDFWPGTCMLHTMHNIGEYLGYSMQRDSMNYFVFFEFPRTKEEIENNIPPNSGYFDVGYWGSKEFFILNWASDPDNGIHKTDGDYVINRFFDNGVPIPYTENCDCMGTKYPTYGECDGNPDNSFWSYYYAWGDGNPDVNAPVPGPIIFYKSNLIGSNDFRMHGFNSAPGVSITSQLFKDHVRRIIKGYIDNGLPVRIHVNQSHNVVAIGYADIDSKGLPENLIALQTSIFTYQPQSKYLVLYDIDHEDYWNKTKTTDNVTLSGLGMWNHHLNNGCSQNGWAKKLDDYIDNNYSLQTIEDNFLNELYLCKHDVEETKCNEGEEGRLPDGTNKRYYGINVECWDNGRLKREYYTIPENPYIIPPENLTCDEIVIRYADGSTNAVQSIRAVRYGYYDDVNEWKILSSYASQAVVVQENISMNGRAGCHSRIEMPQWQDNYYASADNLNSPLIKVRTTLVITFQNGEIKYIEIAPEKTFGIDIALGGSTEQLENRFIECKKNLDYDDQNGNLYYFIQESENYKADYIALRVQTGMDSCVVVDGNISRYGYSTIQNEWVLKQSWNVDSITQINTNLNNGKERLVIWDQSWPDDYIVTGDNLSGEYTERKTVIKLILEDPSNPTIREVHTIDISPR